MKIRSCFVSNSSSSSFIIGIAKILDEEKFNKLDSWNFEFIKEAKNDDEEIEVDDFIDCTHWYNGKVKAGDKFARVYFSKDASYNEDDYEPIYDKNFDSEYEEINELVEDGVIDNPDMDYGEGRDG